MDGSEDTTLQNNLVPTEERKSIVINPNYEIFIFALLIWQLVNSVLWLVVKHPEQDKVIVIVAVGISIILMLDALRRLYKAPNRKRFFWYFHGWLLVVGSLPLPFFSLARLVWYFRMIRELQKSELIAMSNVVVEQRARSTLLAVMLAAIIVVEASSILIISTEAGKVTANIHTASDALWWSLVTVATVGYGDLYPVTNPGRLVGVLMMIVGVGVFSVLTSFLAKWFLAPQRKKILPDSKSIANLPIDMRSQLAGIRKLIDEQETSHQEAMAELREQLDEIERQLLRSG